MKKKHYLCSAYRKWFLPMPTFVGMGKFLFMYANSSFFFALCAFRGAHKSVRSQVEMMIMPAHVGRKEATLRA